MSAPEVTREEGFCPSVLSDGQHCEHWWDCQPCCWCMFDGGGEDCDCDRHAATRATSDPGSSADSSDA